MGPILEVEQKYADDEVGLKNFIEQKVGERVKEFMGQEGSDYIVGVDMANKVEVDTAALSLVPTGLVSTAIKGEYKAGDYRKTHMVKVRPAVKNLLLGCGHKLDTLKIPSVNCADCWKMFFLHQKEMTTTNLNVIKDGGEDEIKKVHGEKYVKNLKRFSVFLFELQEAGLLNAN